MLGEEGVSVVVEGVGGAEGGVVHVGDDAVDLLFRAMLAVFAGGGLCLEERRENFVDAEAEH